MEELFHGDRPLTPGYPGTELGDCKTIDQQADLLAELMTALGYEFFSVVTWSGGGPGSYRLAVLHADRTETLVTFACLSGQYAPPKENLETRLMFRTGFGHWLMRFLAQHAPEAAVKSTLAEEGEPSRAEPKARVEEVIADPKQAAVPLALADFDNRAAGYDNDWAQFSEIDSLELKKFAAPTLVVVGDADADVDPGQSHAAANAIDGAAKHGIENGTHRALFAQPDAHDAQHEVVEFLRAAI